MWEICGYRRTCVEMLPPYLRIKWARRFKTLWKLLFQVSGVGLEGKGGGARA